MLTLIAALAAVAPAPPREAAQTKIVRAQARIQVLAGYRLVGTRDGTADGRPFRTIAVQSQDGVSRPLRVVEFE